MRKQQPPRIIGARWKPILGCPGFYASTSGLVWRAAFIDSRGRKFQARYVTIMKWRKGKTVIVRVRVVPFGRPTLARILLMTFVRLPESWEIARHLDDNSLNHDLKNLAWGSSKDNKDDQARNGNSTRGLRNWRSIVLNPETIKFIKSSYVKGRIKGRPKVRNEFSERALARKIGVTRQVIRSIINDTHWSMRNA